MNKYLVKYIENNIHKSILFDKSIFDKERILNFLKKNNIQNFFFFSDPREPTQLDENTTLFSGEVGFDITVNALIPHLNDKKTIVLDSFGGSLTEGWKIHDYIKNYHADAKIGILGACYSSAMQILLAAKKENRWITENSTGLIHAPWCYEVGNDEVMQRTATELYNEKIKLANFYSKESGVGIDTILDIMKTESYLDSAKMIKLNFVNEIKNNVQMTETKESKEKLTAIETAVNKLLNLFGGGNKPQIKNVIATDVNGVELDFGESEIAVGATATANGAPAEGNFTLADGRTLVFEAGKLTEIIEATNETETLKTENKALKTEIETLKNQIIQKDTEFQNFKKDAETQVTKIKTDFDNFKNQFSNSEPIPQSTPQSTPQKNETPKFSYNKKSK